MATKLYIEQVDDDNIKIGTNLDLLDVKKAVFGSNSAKNFNKIKNGNTQGCVILIRDLANNNALAYSVGVEDLYIDGTQQTDVEAAVITLNSFIGNSFKSGGATPPTPPQPPTPTEYPHVTDGTTFMWLGTDNTGNGYDPFDINTWKDLIGDNDGEIIDGTWDNHALVMNGTSSMVKFKGKLTPSFTQHFYLKRDAVQGAHPRIAAEDPFGSPYLQTTTMRYSWIGGGADTQFVPHKVMPADTWTVISFTHEAGSGKVLFYENGIYAGEVSTPSAMTSVPIATIAGRLQLPARYFKGAYRSVIFYNRALTVEEIQQNYIADLALFNTEMVVPQEVLDQIDSNTQRIITLEERPLPSLPNWTNCKAMFTASAINNFEFAAKYWSENPNVIDASGEDIIEIMARNNTDTAVHLTAAFGFGAVNNRCYLAYDNDDATVFVNVNANVENMDGSIPTIFTIPANSNVFFQYFVNADDSKLRAKSYIETDSGIYPLEAADVAALSNGSQGAISINAANNINVSSILGVVLTKNIGITTIGDDFCRGFSNLRYVDIKAPVIGIGHNFLRECTSLNVPIVFTEGLLVIGDNMLMNCFVFDSDIVLPSTLTYIGHEFLTNAAFNKELALPDSLLKINSGFLRNTRFNNKIRLPQFLKEIGSDFFNSSKAFNQAIRLPNTLELIGQGFMANCLAFNQDITVPTSVGFVGEGFLQNCNNYISTITVLNQSKAWRNTLEQTLSVATSTAPAYVTGISVTGSGAIGLMSVFPNLTGSTGRYRNLRLT